MANCSHDSIHPAITTCNPLDALPEEDETRKQFCSYFNLLIDEDEMSIQEKEKLCQDDDSINTYYQHRHMNTEYSHQPYLNRQFQESKYDVNSYFALNKQISFVDSYSFPIERENVSFLDARSTPSTGTSPPSSSMLNSELIGACESDLMDTAAAAAAEDEAATITNTNPPYPRNIATKALKQWDERYQELIKFKEQNGHCNVPKGKKYKLLRAWVLRQRYHCKNITIGESPRATANFLIRKALLDEIGFDWNPHDDQWHSKYQQLVQFKQLHGHCKVPKAYQNSQLATWVINQRSYFRLLKEGQPNSLTPHRLELLHQIGFDWCR